MLAWPVTSHCSCTWYESGQARDNLNSSQASLASLGGGGMAADMVTVGGIGAGVDAGSGVAVAQLSSKHRRIPRDENRPARKAGFFYVCLAFHFAWANAPPRKDKELMVYD